MSQDSIQISNPKIETADAIINGLVMKIGVNAAVAALQVRFPWMKFPLIDWTIRYIIGQWGSWTVATLSSFVSFTIIKFENEEDRQTYDLAIESLKKTIASGDQDAIDQASKKFNDDFDKLISFGGH